jgi:predicted Zn-dependent protease
MIHFSWEDIFTKALKVSFKTIEPSMVLNCNFSAEDSTFIRFNRSKVRQASQVEQATLDFELNFGEKKTSHSINLSKNPELNESLITSTLEKLQLEVKTLPDDPFFTPLANMGESRSISEGSLPKPEEFIDFISMTLAEYDLAGIFVSGTTHRANANSLGQKHWFSSQSFFFDYSMYSAKEKAIKGSYGGSQFEPTALKAVLDESIDRLKVMDREQKVLKPAKYRCYLAPAAVQEILGILGWHALSGGAYKRGECAFTELFEKKKTLSPKFSLVEDFSIGLAPRFNERGEVFSEVMPIIENGELKNLFVSTTTEKEYGLKTNFASEHEAPRSPVVKTGVIPRPEILKTLGTGLYVSNLHYINWSDKTKGRITGMTRFGCLWVEDGVIQGPIKDLRFDETLYQIFGNGLIDLTDFTQTHVDTMTYGQRSIGGSKSPGIFVEGMNFTL